MTAVDRPQPTAVCSAYQYLLKGDSYICVAASAFINFNMMLQLLATKPMPTPGTRSLLQQSLSVDSLTVLFLL